MSGVYLVDVFLGAEGEIRTRDISLTMRMLYQLSYFGMLPTISSGNKETITEKGFAIKVWFFYV